MPIQRRSPSAARPPVVDDVDDVAEVLLHRAGRAEPVQRVDDEIRVAQPAVAVVPVALRVRRLRDRGGQRGDDRAGLLEVAQLQRDRGADHRLLPVERDRQRAHPVAPVVAGRPRGRRARSRSTSARSGSSAPKKNAIGRSTTKDALLHHVGERRIGGQPQRLLGPTKRMWLLPRVSCRRDRIPTRARPHPDPDARAPLERRACAGPAAAGGRCGRTARKRGAKSVISSMLPRRRRDSVDDHDGGVLHVGLLARHQSDELDAEDSRRRSGFAAPRRAVEQRAEHRVAVEPRKAPPDDVRAAVDRARRSGRCR